MIQLDHNSGPQSTSTEAVQFGFMTALMSRWLWDIPVIQNLDDNTLYKFRSRVETTPTGTGITGGYSPIFRGRNDDSSSIILLLLYTVKEITYHTSSQIH